MTSTLTFTRPDDWHLRLREGAAMAAVVQHSARQFGRAILLHNLRPPITTAAAAMAYRDRVVAAVLAAPGLTPLMTLYLTDTLAVEEIERARQAAVVAAKLYPAGATTHSAAGVANIRNIYPVLEAMQRASLLLLVHGEVIDPAVDIFDREAVFIDRVMQPLRRDFPALKVVFEHITTRGAAQYVAEAGGHTAATVTVHHLLYNRNAIFMGGLRPHCYCLPVLKRELHRQALVAAATSGSDRVFFGTDSAPYTAALKKTSVCDAGCFTALSALELYAEAFDAAGALDKLEGFGSHHGPAFYGLSRNAGSVTLVRQPWVLPQALPFGDAVLKPLRGGETLECQQLDRAAESVMGHRMQPREAAKRVRSRPKTELGFHQA